MTYPPQPGQPDPYGQQNPYGQQPQTGPGQYGQPQTGPGQYGQYGQPQTGPQPQAGQYGQPQTGPGQTAQFGQNPYGQPGQPGGGPPRKSKTGLIIGIVIAAVLVLGGGSVAVWQLTKGDDSANNANDQTSQSSEPTSEDPQTSTDDPTSEPGNGGGGTEEELNTAAQAYVTAVNSQDEAAATDLVCGKSNPGLVYQDLAGKAEMKVDSVEMFSDTSGLVKFGSPGLNTQVPLEFAHQDGAWCALN